MTWLGASNFQIGLLTSMPAITGFILALWVGRFLQRQKNVVSWFSASRVAYVSATDIRHHDGCLAHLSRYNHIAMNAPQKVSGSPPWSRSTRGVVAVLFILAMIWLFITAMPLVEALLISAVLAYLLNPIVIYFSRRFHIRRTFAVVIVYALTMIIAVSLPAIIGAFAFGQFENFNTSLGEATRELQNWLSRPVYIFGYRLSSAALLDNVSRAVGGVLGTIPGGSLTIITGLTTNLLWGLVIVISLYYFMKDGPKIKPWLVDLFPNDYRNDISLLLDDIEDVWRISLRVQIFIFFVLLVLFLLGSALVIILYQVGLIPFSWIGMVLMLILVYALVQQVDNLWLRPQMMGSRLRLHPAIVFVGLVGALALSGVLGAIIVIPAIATLKVIGRYIHRKMLGLPPWSESEPAPPAPDSQQGAPTVDENALERTRLK